MIMSGELTEGDKIKEDQLSDLMAISKTPLRKALRVLSVEGLIRLVSNRGVYIYKDVHVSTGIPDSRPSVPMPTE
jgi:DNA-binding GntR family transcriptional regulator